MTETAATESQQASSTDHGAGGSIDVSERDLVHLTRRDDGVAVIRLDNGKLNPLSQALLWQLYEICESLRADLPGAVVVTGNPKALGAGADVSEFGGPERGRAYGEAFVKAFGSLASLPRITICAIGGYALGGGTELALACDFRIAADNARLGLPEVTLGIIPGGGATQRLPRLIGTARAKNLIFTGRHLRADEALAIGLVDEVVPADELLDRAIAQAATFASGPLRAHAMAKHAIDHGLDRSLDDGLALEQELFVEVFTTDDARVGLASFLDNGPGKATFTGT